MVRGLSIAGPTSGASETACTAAFQVAGRGSTPRLRSMGLVYGSRKEQKQLEIDKCLK